MECPLQCTSSADWKACSEGTNEGCGWRAPHWKALMGPGACRSRGAAVTDVIIFAIGNDWLARAAINAILIQGVGQYLVNLNIWTHNILTLLARSRVRKLHHHLTDYCHSVWTPDSILLGFPWTVTPHTPSRPIERALGRSYPAFTRHTAG